MGERWGFIPSGLGLSLGFYSKCTRDYTSVRKCVFVLHELAASALASTVLGVCKLSPLRVTVVAVCEVLVCVCVHYTWKKNTTKF